MSDEELFQILKDNQRLFFTFFKDDVWSIPSGIQNSAKAFKPILVTGKDNSALIIYSLDQDNKIDTDEDIELYITLYQFNQWTTPVQLTSNKWIEYNVQAAYFDKSYIISWECDIDNDFSTQADKFLYYSTFSVTDKQIIISENKLVEQNIHGFVMKEWQDTITLLYSQLMESQQTNTETNTHYIWESIYLESKSWSTPRKTILETKYPVSGKLFNTQNNLFLTCNHGASLYIAYRDINKWYPFKILSDIAKGLIVSEFEFYIDEDILHIGIIGNYKKGIIEHYRKRRKKRTTEEEYMNGIFYNHKTLSHDLTISSISINPQVLTINSDAEIKFSVFNNGFVPSPNYNVVVKFLNSDKTVKSFSNNTSLSPGENKIYEFAYLIDRELTKIELSLYSQSNDLLNRFIYPIKILPDLAIRSLSHKHSNTYVVIVDELKGISVPPTTISFYLQIDSQRINLSSCAYNHNASEPLEITLINDKISAKKQYQIIAEINANRSLDEEDYSNNLGSYIYNPLPDFKIDNVNVTSDSIHINIENKSLQAFNDNLLLIISDDPVLASQSVQTDNYNPLVSQLISLSQNPLEYVISRETNERIDQRINGKNIYTVINPFRDIPELDYNNNVMKTYVNICQNENNIELSIKNIKQFNNNIQITIENNGNGSALDSVIQLINFEKNAIIAQRNIPILSAYSSETIKFRNIESGNYNIRIDFSSTQTFLEKTIEVKEIQEVENLEGRDIILKAISIENADIITQNNQIIFNVDKTENDFLMVQIEFDILNFLTNYRKPLIKVPLIFEIKKGLNNVYREEHQVFLKETAGNTHYIKTFNLSKDSFENGLNSFTVNVPERDDEIKGSNNTLTILVEKQTIFQ